MMYPGDGDGDGTLVMEAGNSLSVSISLVAYLSSSFCRERVEMGSAYEAALSLT